jgi:hypothetical protein
MLSVSTIRQLASPLMYGLHPHLYLFLYSLGAKIGLQRSRSFFLPDFYIDFILCLCQNHDIMAVVAGVGWHVTRLGEAGIAPYLIALSTATII